MKRYLRISLLQHSAHSFLHSARKSTRLIDMPTVLCRLSDNQRIQEKEIVRWLALALIATIWLATSETRTALEMQQSGIPVVVPRLGVVFFAALFLGLATLRTASMLVIAKCIERILESVGGVDEPATLTPLYEPGSAFLTPFLKQFRFFRSSRTHDVLRLIIALFVAVAAIAIYFLTVLLLALEAIQFIRFGGSWVTLALGTITLAILAIQVLIQIVFYTPFKFYRNNGFIRWNFLLRLSRINPQHPQASRWLKQGDES